MEVFGMNNFALLQLSFVPRKPKGICNNYNKKEFGKATKYKDKSIVFIYPSYKNLENFK